MQAKTLCFTLIILGAACRSPLSVPDNEAILLETCEDFCEQALMCSERFVNDWETTAQTDCTDKCVSFASDIVSRTKPECMSLLIDELDCASTISTCAEFASFESEAYAELPPVPHPCRDELGAALANDCT